MRVRLNRRQFVGLGACALGNALLRSGRAADSATTGSPQGQPPLRRADSVIWIWLPGGIAQADMWDPKLHTPFREGMRGSELLSTCGGIHTSAKGISLGKGLDHLAEVINLGTVVRTIVNDSPEAMAHLPAQYRTLTGYGFPPAAKAPSIGSIVSRFLGPRQTGIPPYVWIGRDAVAREWEDRFIQEYTGAGFYGPHFAPLTIPNPLAPESPWASGNPWNRGGADRRLELLKALARSANSGGVTAPEAAAHLDSFSSARALLDSTFGKTLSSAAAEDPDLLRAYEPEIARDAVKDPSYFHGARFGRGLLLARRLVEQGVRFVQVELPFERFKGFDMHDHGGTRMPELKKQIDRPIARLIQDLEASGQLDRTLVVVASEFGRTVGGGPGEPEETRSPETDPTGANLIVNTPAMYGFHRHFNEANAMLLFGCGFKKGVAFGRTADQHPMVPVENPVLLRDIQATVLATLGIPANAAFTAHGRSFYVTEDGRGKVIKALLD